MFQEPSAPPLNIQASAPEPDASSTLKVTWESPSLVQANGVITGFKLYYVTASSSDDIGTATIVSIADPKQTSVQINNLEVWTNYRIWMKASTSVGDSPASAPVVGRTGEDGE